MITVIIIRSLSARRAWIEILFPGAGAAPQIRSLSARRAWIEISGLGKNKNLLASLSARRAWIEMQAVRPYYCANVVALRKESVDRNVVAPYLGARVESRSPQGERG